MNVSSRILAAGILLLVAAQAGAEGSRQLGTGGASQVEGAAGGGLTPWAVIAGYATREERGLNACLTRVRVDDFDLTAGGLALGWNNRFELSLARQRFDVGRVVPGADLEQDILGLKLRLFGDVIYTAAPQVSVGFQYKRNDDFTIPALVGARDDTGTELYVSAAKVWLAGAGGYNGFANLTLRLTDANQFGLLGFGGDRDDGRSVQAEAAAGLFLHRRLALGVEYRQKPDNLSAFAEDDAWDVFLAWFPSRHLSLVGAYVDLGDIAGLADQRGAYLSLGATF